MGNQGVVHVCIGLRNIVLHHLVVSYFELKEKGCTKQESNSK